MYLEFLANIVFWLLLIISGFVVGYLLGESKGYAAGILDSLDSLKRWIGRIDIEERIGAEENAPRTDTNSKSRA